jgi:hypothetical protein
MAEHCREPHIISASRVRSLVCAVVVGPFARADGACPEPGVYSLLRFDENYDYLKNPSCMSDFWDPVKYIALNRWQLSSGMTDSFELAQAYELARPSGHSPDYFAPGATNVLARPYTTAGVLLHDRMGVCGRIERLRKPRANTMKPWTTKDTPPQTGKRIIVTGANSGIGWHTAAELARAGAEVVIPARNQVKADDAVSPLRPRECLPGPDDFASVQDERRIRLPQCHSGIDVSLSWPR